MCAVLLDVAYVARRVKATLQRVARVGYSTGALGSRSANSVTATTQCMVSILLFE